jgi:hypothetical protein
MRGTRGTLYLFSDRYEVVPDALPHEPFPARTPLDRSLDRKYRESFRREIDPRKAGGNTDTAPHARNFLDCVKSRQRCACDIETGHRSTTATLLANIALRTQSLLTWDAPKERFRDNEKADALLRCGYRPPHQFPA